MRGWWTPRVVHQVPSRDIVLAKLRVIEWKEVTHAEPCLCSTQTST